MRKPGTLRILHADAGIIVVDKPAGLLSIPGRNPAESSVLEMLRKQFPEVLPVHRLDRGTSGVLVMAVHADTHRDLSLQFENRTVTKVYVALVLGVPPGDEFEISLGLRTDQQGLARVANDGKASVTVCRVMERFSGYALIEAHPLSGRQHQIRAHLAAAGYPLIVDPDYGSAEALTISGIKRSARTGSSAGSLLTRTPLHAWRLSFRHPLTGAPVTYETDPPKDMLAALNQLRKWAKQ